METRPVRIEVPSGAGVAREVRLGGNEAVLDGRTVPARILPDGGGGVEAIEVGGETVPVRTARAKDRVYVWCAGRTYEFRQAPPAARAGRPAAFSAGLLSPMPGRVRKLLVAEGESVTRGQVLLVLEAMKMEHAIRSPRDGRVASLPFREGDLVEAGVAVAEVV